MLTKAAQAGDAVAVLFVDLDKFKEVNDLKGHLTGDGILQAVAGRLADHTGPETELARWGGDEFVMVRRLKGSSQEAVVLAEALRASITKPIALEMDTVLVDATIGIALFPHHGSLPDDLIRAADMAMYAAKGGKHGTVRLYDPGLAADLIERHELEESLRQAIPTNALQVFFQPIVNARSKRCEALEALLRWNEPSYGQVSPDKFIPLAERTGEIIAMGNWVLGEACRTAAAWEGERPPAVSVNVSVAQMLAGEFPGVVRDALSRSGLSADRLHLEVTESVFGGAHENIASALHSIRELGARVSLDDFGTGLSSLSDLHKLPIDIIKIDKSFVWGLEKGSRAIVDATLSIARALRLEVVAEGVEEPWQAEMLRALGVDYLQGYLYGKPMPSAEAQHYLAERQKRAGQHSRVVNKGAPLGWRREMGEGASMRTEARELADAVTPFCAGNHS